MRKVNTGCLFTNKEKYLQSLLHAIICELYFFFSNFLFKDSSFYQCIFFLCVRFCVFQHLYFDYHLNLLLCGQIVPTQVKRTEMIV